MAAKLGKQKKVEGEAHRAGAVAAAPRKKANDAKPHHGAMHLATTALGNESSALEGLQKQKTKLKLKRPREPDDATEQRKEREGESRGPATKKKVLLRIQKDHRSTQDPANDPSTDKTEASAEVGGRPPLHNNISSSAAKRRREEESKSPSGGLQAPESANAVTAEAAAAAAAAAARWGKGRQWVVLLSFSPLVLLRRRSSSKKQEKHQGPVSCLFTADEHTGFVEDMGASTGLSVDKSRNSHNKKALNPVMPLIRRVQGHLASISSSVASAYGAECSEERSAKEGPVGSRMRECVAAEAARVAAAASDPNWIASACMRPDVVHQCLLSFLDSPLIKLLRLQQPPPQQQPLELLVHTLDGKLLRINSAFRVPRTFKVFKKVMEMALASPTGRLEAKTGDQQEQQNSQPLIEVLQPPFSRHFPEALVTSGGFCDCACVLGCTCVYSWVALSESHHAPPVSLRRFLNELPEVLKTGAADCATNSNKLASPASRRKQHQGQQGVPPVVFVISASPAVDSALVPLWASSNGDDADCSNAGSESNTQEDQRPQQQVLPISPHSYPTPAALRCDRLLHELGRAAFRNANAAPLRRSSHT
ncbi:uncharacterized protein LOC34620756 [Cyclospora cayetanensis]|uniref:Uncharacterized protein LOC34620756 n=1 Tax=Cyclospora cayetanensis TaxID=88456 RepID=A0A6P6RWA5_9EIME|nr:uncharacterized protein LOC34620756 [Cyclospora cayetanensis]